MDYAGTGDWKDAKQAGAESDKTGRYKPKNCHWYCATDRGIKEPTEEFMVGKPCYEELQQHEPLNPRVNKHPYLRNICPYELSTLTRLGKERSRMHLREIEKVPGADVQYSLLIHYHKIAGTIPMVHQAPPITIEEEVEAFNLYQSAHFCPKGKNRGHNTTT